MAGVGHARVLPYASTLRTTPLKAVRLPGWSPGACREEPPEPRRTDDPARRHWSTSFSKTKATTCATRGVAPSMKRFRRLGSRPRRGGFDPWRRFWTNCATAGEPTGPHHPGKTTRLRGRPRGSWTRRRMPGAGVRIAQHDERVSRVPFEHTPMAERLVRSAL